MELSSIRTTAALFLLAGAAHAQSFVNGDFENGTTGWTTCTIETGPATTYGGTGTGHVAEVDGNFSTSASDDRILCQTISGFTVGARYAVSFDATRRGTGTPPATVSTTVKMSGSALGATITRTGGYDMVQEHIAFTATQTSLNFTITPDFEGSFGMIFDNFAIALVSALPIELLGFDVRPEGTAVGLQWATASETDNALFQVERSGDNEAWTVVAEMPGAGNSAAVLHYATTDNAPLAGQAYYRLRQIDRDGASTYSDTRAVYMAASAPALRVWPDPATDHVFVQGADTDAVELLNTAGARTACAQQRLNGGLLLDLTGLPPGLYVLRASGASAICGRFIKQ